MSLRRSGNVVLDPAGRFRADRLFVLRSIAPSNVMDRQ
jgi:hypothetical protein